MNRDDTRLSNDLSCCGVQLKQSAAYVMLGMMFDEGIFFRDNILANNRNSHIILSCNKGTSDIHISRMLASKGIFLTCDKLWSSPQLLSDLSSQLELDLASFYTRTIVRTKVNKGPVSFYVDDLKKGLSAPPSSNINDGGSDIIWYTDGSATYNRSKAGYAVVNGNNFDLKEYGRIPGVANNYRAELFGFLRALQLSRDDQNVTIMTDCLSGILAVSSFEKLESVEDQLKVCDSQLLSSIVHERKRVASCQLVYVKAHSKIPGNEEADKWAKEALNSSVINDIVPATHLLFDIVCNGDTPHSNIRPYVVSFLSNNKADDSKLKYGTLHNEYHSKASVDLDSLNTTHQRFLLRLCSNELCTLSKMSKWGNKQNTLDTKCPRCLDAHEDQLHVLLDCKSNTTYFRDAMIKIDQVIMANMKPGKRIRGKNQFWGLPYIISNTGVRKATDQECASSEWRHNMYLGLLGYTSVNVMKEFNKNFPVKKPLRTLRSIAHILMETSYSIWTDRCILHAENQEIDLYNTNNISTVG